MLFRSESRREEIYFQMHFGATYNKNGDYGWSRDLNQIKDTFEWEMKTLNTDYIDFGFLHCIDDNQDLEDILSSGLLDYVQELKQQGKVHYIGFSSHTPSVANKVLDTGLIDLMMFSINPAYDFEHGDEYGIGTSQERYELFKRCAKEGVGISVMKPFHGGNLLDENLSPFKKSLTHDQCLQYALDRLGVLSVVPGVRHMEDLETLLHFLNATKEEKDYSLISSLTPSDTVGTCVYCHHCQPCPVGIDIGLVNKYYDLSLAGDKMADSHYQKLTIKADACVHCGHCDSRCPFKCPQSERMSLIHDYYQSH